MATVTTGKSRRQRKTREIAIKGQGHRHVDKDLQNFNFISKMRFTSVVFAVILIWVKCSYVLGEQTFYDFSVTDMEGNIVELSKYKGKVFSKLLKIT